MDFFTLDLGIKVALLNFLTDELLQTSVVRCAETPPLHTLPTLTSFLHLLWFPEEATPSRKEPVAALFLNLTPNSKRFPSWNL
jgi:hypothetical protein